LALLAGFLAFLLRGGLGSKLKVGLFVILAVTLLGVASYRIEAVRVRWESTFREGEVAGRDIIFSAAWKMFEEKPLIGWGPVYHLSELGSRLGVSTRDPHSLYLWLLTEGGLLGAFPFLAGLWFSWHAAWKARDSIQGALPMAMVLCILIANLKGTGFIDKLFWFVLAYAQASSSYVSLPRSRKAVM